MEKIKEFRKRNKMSQAELASNLGISQSMVAKWETGKNYPSVENLIVLSNLFNCTIDELVKGVNNDI